MMDFVIYYIPDIVLCLIAYFIGSIPFGLILTRIFTKQDIRDIGSGNIGATNVLRTGNKKLAAITLLLDAVKGMLPIIVFGLLFAPSNAYFLTLIFGLAAILGHCFPIWLKFKGGKGVATTLGVLLAAVPYVGLISAAIWLIAAFTLRISSLAALIAAALAPLLTFAIYGAMPAVICALIAALVFWRHKDNIKRILKGEEPKIGKKEKTQ